jgi:rhamnulokinase
MSINTIYQLAAEHAARLSDDTVLLHVPDLIGYWATGVLANDVTQASTSSLVDVRTRQWSPSVLHALGFPASNFLPLSEPGTIRGESLDPRLGRMVLVGAPTHDTASAFVGTPLIDPDQALILSLGTWALIGVEAIGIVPTEAARELNLTHELGADGTVRFLSNLQGMWLLEECRRWWAQQDGVSPDLADLMEAARISTAWKFALDSEAPELAEPGQSPITLAQWITTTGEVSDWYSDRGAVVRSILEAIVVRVAQRAREIEAVLGSPRHTLHVVGGGSRIPMLMQWLADATGKEVIAGPVEAAAVGNAVIQWQAHGQLSGVEQGRTLIRQMPEIRRYYPENSSEPWRAAEQH